MTAKRVVWIDRRLNGMATLGVDIAVYNATERQLIEIGEAAATAGMISRSPTVSQSDYSGAELLSFISASGTMKPKHSFLERIQKLNWIEFVQQLALADAVAGLMH